MRKIATRNYAHEGLLCHRNQTYINEHTQDKHAIRLAKRIIPIALTLLLSFLVVFGVSVAAFRANMKTTRTFGVKAGDWIKYGDFTASYSSNDPSATQEPSEIVEHKNIGWIRNTVENISGPVATFESLIHFENNDTETKSLEEVNIESGYSSDELRAAFMFVSAGLREGDSIYTSSEFEIYRINETISREYIRGVSRETNHLYGSTVMPIDEDQTLLLSVDYYWDKETGILCEYLGGGSLTTENYITSWSQSYQIVDTEISWVGQNNTLPDMPRGYWLGVVAIGVIVVSVLLVLFLRRQRRGKRRKR